MALEGQRCLCYQCQAVRAQEAALDQVDPRYLFIARGVSKMKMRAMEYLTNYFQSSYGEVQAVMAAPYRSHEHARHGRERRKAIPIPNIAFVVMKRIETVQLILQQERHMVAGYVVSVEASKRCYEGQTLGQRLSSWSVAPAHREMGLLVSRESLPGLELANQPPSPWNLSVVRPLHHELSADEHNAMKHQLPPQPCMSAQVQVQRWQRAGRSQASCGAAFEQHQVLDLWMDLGPWQSTGSSDSSASASAWPGPVTRPGDESPLVQFH